MTLKKLDTANFEYHIYTKEDGATFVHVSSYRDEKVQAEVLNFIASANQRLN